MTAKRRVTSSLEDTIAAAEARLALLYEAQKAEREAEVSRFEPDGDEPTISFTQEYNYKTYTYVAFKAANGYWYVTGRLTGAFTWPALCWMFKQIREGDFHVVTQWTHVRDM